MTTTKYPKKIFKIGALQNNILTNADENARFLEPRINALKSCQYGSPAFYSTLEDIFTEFVDVYEFDKTTAVLPEPFGSFRSEDHKKEWMENHLLQLSLIIILDASFTTIMNGLIVKDICRISYWYAAAINLRKNYHANAIMRVIPHRGNSLC